MLHSMDLSTTFKLYTFGCHSSIPFGRDHLAATCSVKFRYFYSAHISFAPAGSTYNVSDAGSYQYPWKKQNQMYVVYLVQIFRRRLQLPFLIHMFQDWLTYKSFYLYLFFSAETNNLTDCVPDQPITLSPYHNGPSCKDKGNEAVAICAGIQ